MPEQSQYAAASHIPLIKSPSLRVPRPVELPPDIHPLPDTITPYFVYPFTIESHILTLESSRRSTLAAHAVRTKAYLQSREDEKERRKMNALRKIAPGFEPQGSPLVPVRKDMGAQQSISPPARQMDVMDDLVEQLAALDSTSNPLQ